MGRQQRIPWSKVEPLLLLAVLAPSPQKRDKLLNRIMQRFDIAGGTLRNRLDFLGYRAPSAQLGYAAIQQWERDMTVIIRIFGASPLRLRLAVSQRAWAVRRELEQNRNRHIGLAEVSEMLRVPVKVVRSWCDDLDLIERDEHGKIPLGELRRFFTETGWWMTKNYRYLRRTGEWPKK